MMLKKLYDKLSAKVNSSNYNRDKSEIENKIPDASGLV